MRKGVALAKVRKSSASNFMRKLHNENARGWCSGKHFIMNTCVKTGWGVGATNRRFF